MKIILLIALFSVFLISQNFTESQALRQEVGTPTVELSPGETKTFTWRVISDEPDSTITIVMGSDRHGKEFLSFPESVELGPMEGKDIEITVTIPQDHPGGVIINPHVSGTQVDSSGGQVKINVQAFKMVEITILQNENEQYWSNTAYDPPEEVEMKVEEKEKVVEEKEQAPSFGINQPTQTESETQEEGGGCLIATAAYGSEMAQQVQLLRELRDVKLLSTSSGTAFMSGFNTLYYSFSPTIADIERENPIFREVVKITITPLLTSLSILNHVDMDSEAEVLGYGISLILLNIGMYFVAPAIVITKLRKRL